MNIIADIIVILILAICIFFGVKRGLTGVIVKLLSIVISLVLSLILFKPVSAIIINHTDIYNNLTSAIENSLNSKDENAEEKCVAMALLPPEIQEGCHIAYEMMEYRMIK